MKRLVMGTNLNIVVLYKIVYIKFDEIFNSSRYKDEWSYTSDLVSSLSHNLCPSVTPLAIYISIGCSDHSN